MLTACYGECIQYFIQRGGREPWRREGDVFVGPNAIKINLLRNEIQSMPISRSQSEILLDMSLMH